jgi:nitrate/nitrite-specific signal transduction histidine kinase
MLLSGLPLASVQAQSRMSDKDVEATMRNLREDAKSFRSAFDSSVEKSTIRKTSREKDAKAQVRSFQDQTETLLNQFKKEKQANDYLPSVMDTASQIDVLLRAVELDSTTTMRWNKVRADLDQIAEAHGLPASSGSN